jgi:diguanylate cyclase (GGDEF)-like protein
MQVEAYRRTTVLRFLTAPTVLFGAVAALLVLLVINDDWNLLAALVRLDVKYTGWYIDEIATAFIAMGFAWMVLVIRRSHELRQEIARRRRAEDAAERLARHDSLTGLPNRRVLQEIITRMIAELPQGGSLAVMLIDLDEFKTVNDVHGHAVGDDLLCAVAERLGTTVAKHGTVARLGGDEFVIVMPFVTGKDEVSGFADRIVSQMSEPFFPQDRRICIGISMGIGTCPSNGKTAVALLHAADVAKFRAKEAGRGTFRFFEPNMDRILREQAELKVELREAIAGGQIVPFYQPLIDLATRNVDAFEVLARWEHPTRGLLTPDKFISLAENMKLITPLTLALFRQVCADARDRPKHYRLALNISPTQLPEAPLFVAITAMMREADIAMSRLEIELTESSLIKDTQQAARIIDGLRAMGITVVLDDFGTGYSSLYLLRQIQFDKVKIDRSFVQSIGHDPRAASYVQAMIGLGHHLHLQTTAEGIEDAEVLAKLEEFGCTFGQGFFFAKPMSGRDIRRSMPRGAIDDPEMHWAWSPTLSLAA